MGSIVVMCCITLAISKGSIKYHYLHYNSNLFYKIKACKEKNKKSNTILIWFYIIVNVGISLIVTKHTKSTIPSILAIYCLVL